MRYSLAGFLLAIVCVLADDKGSFTTTDLTWHDTARNRDVPARLYAPTTGTAPFPVIIFSHGLGGSREGYGYLGEYWSSHGFISVHVQHLGSDSELLHENRPFQAMRKATMNPDNLVNRPKDISFAIDQITALNNADGPWKGKFDLGKIGIGGHSFGAYTTMAIAGETFPQGKNFGDPRVKAVVAMSTPGQKDRPGFGGNYSTVHIPALHLTGTEDKIGIIPGDSAEFRRRPFDESPGPDTYLVIFKGADHMVFSGRERRDSLFGPSGENDAATQKLVCEATTAFWKAYLLGDASSKQWLAQGGLKQSIGASGTVEIK